jgi:hypothetical protein
MPSASHIRIRAVNSTDERVLSEASDYDVTGQNVAIERLGRFHCLREVPGSNLGPERGYPD